MASVVRCGKKWKVYWCYTVNGVRHRSSRTFASKQAAHLFAGSERQTAHLKNPIYIYETSATENNHFFQKFSKNTKKFYIYALEGFFSDINKPISSITRSDIQGWIGRQTVKARSVNAKLTAIFSYFSWASKQYGFTDPTSTLSLLREDRPKRNLLTIEQFRYILSIGSELFRQRALFLVNTGLRASEFCNLRWQRCHTDDENYGWVDLSRSMVFVVGKGRKDRVVSLNTAAMSVLSRMAVSGGCRSEFVFLADGRRLRKEALYQQFRKLADKTGIPFSPHSLRHLFCNTLLSQGLSSAIVAKIMGHSSVLITEEVYGHLNSAAFKPPEVG